MERETIEEEGRDYQSFLTAWGAVLWVPQKHVSSTIADGEHVFGHSLGHFPSVIHCHGGACPWNSPSNCVGSPHIQMAMPFIWGGGYRISYSYQRAYLSEVKRGEVPHRPQRELPGGLLPGLDLVQVTRQRYFEAHHPTFDQEGSHDLSGLFWEMITSANLLDSELYEIQEFWTRQKDLQYAHHVMKSTLKGLWFFHLMFPPELPKVMGLKGIHHPDALCCHVGLSYCPWCGKKGQNKGTVVNHLWTTCYKLGLVCSRCLHFPLITSEAIWHHGQVCKHPGMEEEDGRPGNDDSSSSDWYAPNCPTHHTNYVPNYKHPGMEEEDRMPGRDDLSSPDWFSPSCPLHPQHPPYQLHV